jgi:hypothetical protein
VLRWLVLLVAIVACTRSDEPAKVQPPPAPAPRHVESNIARADYVGPNVCGECHAEQYAAWSQSLHRVMNARVSDPGAVIGDFHTTVKYGGGEARFSREGSDYVMTLARGGTSVRYRVTRTIGRRGLQEYVGIEDGHAEEVRLPFGWWPRRAAWFPQPYFDPWLGAETNFDAYAPVREPWAERCPWCHSTYPFEQRIERASGPKGLGYGLEQMFAAAPGSDRLHVDQQVTTGISCESCHLGGRAHTAGGGIHFVPQGAQRRDHAPKLPGTFTDERRSADVVNTVCAQCHSGPSPRLSDGTSLRNSSEALDLAASACTGAKCTDCHDPHRADSRADEQRSVAACTHCHPAFADATHAGAGHDKTNCLDCHMPKLVMGIDHYVRTHRIQLPVTRARVAEGAPNACNLCHLDQSIGWTLDALHMPAPPDADTDTPAGELYLASTHGSFRLIAAHAYARSPLGKAALRALERGLADPLAYVRTWTQFAIEDINKAQVKLRSVQPHSL